MLLIHEFVYGTIYSMFLEQKQFKLNNNSIQKIPRGYKLVLTLFHTFLQLLIENTLFDMRHISIILRSSYMPLISVFIFNSFTLTKESKNLIILIAQV